MSGDPNFGFVVAAYAFAFIIVGGMTFSILRDYVDLKKALSQFAARPAGEREAAGKGRQ